MRAFGHSSFLFFKLSCDLLFLFIITHPTTARAVYGSRGRYRYALQLQPSASPLWSLSHDPDPEATAELHLELAHGSGILALVAILERRALSHDRCHHMRAA